MFFDIQTDGCLTMLGVLFFFRQLLKIVFFLVPIGLIVMLTIDFTKGVFSSDNNKKTIGLVIKRLFFCVFLYLVPNITFSLFSILLGNEDSQNCWNYVNEKSLEEVREILDKQENDYDDYIKEMEEEAKRKANEDFKNVFEDNSLKYKVVNSEGAAVGNTYNLTDKQLKGIAYLCQKEQGSAKGAAAEASLMANRFELYAGSSYQKDGTGLYNYIKNSKWWYNSKKYMSNPGKVDKEVLDAVKSVLVLGKRTLPFYVDEHDCIYCGGNLYDISYIVNDGKKITSKEGRLDHSNYKQDITKIYNRYDAVYTFHSFPTKNSDPFGYTKQAKDKIKSKTNK